MFDDETFYFNENVAHDMHIVNEFWNKKNSFRDVVSSIYKTRSEGPLNI